MKEHRRRSRIGRLPSWGTPPRPRDHPGGVAQAGLAYLPQAKAELTCEPIGFGACGRTGQVQDAAQWVADLREREWRC